MQHVLQKVHWKYQYVVCVVVNIVLLKILQDSMIKSALEATGEEHGAGADDEALEEIEIEGGMEQGEEEAMEDDQETGWGQI